MILPPDNLYINLPIRTPAAVPPANAINPSKVILRVDTDKNNSPVAFAPTVNPKIMVTPYIIAFCRTFVMFGTTLISLIKLPSIKHPTNGVALGTNKLTKIVTMIGKRIFSVSLTLRFSVILTRRSFFVVSARIIGG